MVALAFLCTNLMLGLTFGTYGPIVAVMSQEYPVSRTLLSGGLALVVTLMGLLAPLVGRAIVRWSIRLVLAVGLAVLALMFVLASTVQSAAQFVLVFGVLGGIAAACLVIVPPSTLVNNWFVEQRGKAIGIVMIPFLVMAMPPVAALAIGVVGWRMTMLGLAGLVLLLLPLTRMVVDRPDDVGQLPLGGDSVVARSTAHAARDDAQTPIPGGRQAFWAIIYCGGVVSGAGVTISTHVVPFATGAGFGLQSAALLLTVLAGAGMAGGVLFGHLADRLGGARSLGLICVALAVLWPALPHGASYPVIAVVVAGIGLCVTAVIPVVATLCANVFGSASFARVIGLYSLCAMPFSLAMPVLAGVLFDLSGSYRAVFYAFGLLFAIAVALLFLFLNPVETAARRPAPEPA